MAVDASDEIKNCPSMIESYGNISEVSLSEAVNNKSFSRKGNITKGQIEICKGCKFSYVCCDCRACVEDPENIYSKPLE